MALHVILNTLFLPFRGLSFSPSQCLPHSTTTNNCTHLYCMPSPTNHHHRLVVAFLLHCHTHSFSSTTTQDSSPLDDYKPQLKNVFGVFLRHRSHSCQTVPPPAALLASVQTLFRWNEEHVLCDGFMASQVWLQGWFM